MLCETWKKIRKKLIRKRSFYYSHFRRTLISTMIQFDSNFLISRPKLTSMYYFPFSFSGDDRINFTYVWSPFRLPLSLSLSTQIESIKPKILVWTERWKLVSGVHCSHSCRISASRTSNWSLFLEPSKVSTWWVIHLR